MNHIRRIGWIACFTCLCFLCTTQPEAHAEKPQLYAKYTKKNTPKKNQSRKRKKKTTLLTYEVLPGDTLAKIAKTHGVSTRDIKRWNRLRGTNLSVGQDLKIHAKIVPKAKAKKTYTVKKGDTFRSIAKKKKVDVGDLISWNPSLDPRSLRAGAKVAIFVEVARKAKSKKKRGRLRGAKGVSIGTPNRGFLNGGTQMRNGKGYRVRNPSRAWGTKLLISTLQKGLSATKNKYRRAPNLVIGDLSREHGGYLSPHKSHRSGRDADVAYYVKGNRDVEWRFVHATPKTLDVEKTWYLLDRLIRTRNVTYIFVNYELQKVLYKHAVKKGVSKARLANVFEYPKGRGSTGIIRHSRGHDNHFHIRVDCSRKDKACRQ